MNMLKYDFFARNNGVDLSYRVNDNEDSIAAYIYLYNKGSERVVVHKTNYCKVLDNYHIPLVSGRYQIKFFLRRKYDTKYSDSLLTEPVELKVLENYLPLLYQNNSTKEIVNLLSESGLNKIDFATIVSEKHKLRNEFSYFSSIFLENSLNILSKKSCTYDTAKFFFNCIFYIADKNFILKHKEEIISQILLNKSQQSRRNILFWIGLMEYKIGHGNLAQTYFDELLAYKDELEFHQTGAIAYLNSILVFDSVQVNNHNIILFNNSRSGKIEGCLLISCDYGYYLAYIKDNLKNISNGVLVHLHFVITLESEVHKIAEELKGLSNINYSYELLDGYAGNLKTYYSIARYMILNQIIASYKLPILVGDADLDFDLLNLSEIFKSVKPNDIILRKTSSDLPWLRVLAGFNIFGSNTFDSSFLIYLKKYLTYCILNGQDGWMLDQVALSQCLYFCENGKLSDYGEIVFLDCDEFLNVNIKQVSNRQQKREEIAAYKKSSVANII